MNEDVKSTGVHIHSRADELIACLEGEIAKRDAWIVELNGALKYVSDEFDCRCAELAAIKAQEPVAFAFRYDDGSWHDVSATQHSAGMVSLYAAPVSEAKAQGVVMPERKTKADYGVYIDEFADEAAAIYNAALDEVARLSAAPVQQVSVPDGWVKTAQLLLEDIAGMLVNDATFEQCRDKNSTISKVSLKLNEIDGLLAAAPAAPAADALYEAVTPDVVEWLRCGLAANNRLVDGTHPALERVRAALAANRAKGVV